jgi:hypothetical protein
MARCAAMASTPVRAVATPDVDTKMRKMPTKVRHRITVRPPAIGGFYPSHSASKVTNIFPNLSVCLWVSACEAGTALSGPETAKSFPAMTLFPTQNVFDMFYVSIRFPLFLILEVPGNA